MNGKSMRVFEVDGRHMVFDTAAFSHLFNTMARKAGMGMGKYEEEVGRAVYVGPDAVHSWRNGLSGPSDLEKVEALAAFWGIQRENLLIRAKNRASEEAKEQTMKNKHVEGQDDAMRILCIEREFEAERRIYAAIIEFLEDYNLTNRFEGYRQSIVDSISLPPETALIFDGFSVSEYVDEMLGLLKNKKLLAVYLVARQEEYDLYGRPTYHELMSYIDNTLADLIDAPPREGHSAYDDYCYALRRLHEIVHGEIFDEEEFDANFG